MRVLTALAVAFVALAQARGDAQTYSTTPLQTWGVNGAVTAVERVGNRLFVAGNFTRAARTRGGAVSISGFTGELRSGFNPRIPSGVSAIASDGRGGWYVGGEFGPHGGVAGARLVRVFSDGDIDRNFAPAISGIVADVAVAPDRVFIAGQLSAVDGQTPGVIAALDPLTGALLSFRTAIRQVSRIRVLSGNRLFVFGASLGDPQRSGLAMIDATTGALLSWAPDIPVFALADFSIVDETLYVCGNFTSVNGQPRQGVAALDLTSGEVLPWNPQALAAVERINGCALTVSGDRLFMIRDTFLMSNGGRRRDAYSINRTTGVVFPEWQPPLAFNLEPFRPTPSLFAANGKIYFYNAAGLLSGDPYVNLWAVDPVTGLVDSAFVPRPDGLVRAIAIDGGNLIIGGTFTGVESVARHGVLAVDLDTDMLVDWNPLPVDAQGRGFAVASGRLFVHAAANSFELGAFDLATLQPVSWPRVDVGIVNRILAIGDRVVVAGHPQPAEPSGEALLILDAISGVRATPPVMFQRAIAGVDVKLMVGSGDRVYIGGVFERINGQGRPGLAAVQVGSGALLPWAPALSSGRVADRIVPGLGFVVVEAPFLALQVVDPETGVLVSQVQPPPPQTWAIHEIAGPLVSMTITAPFPADPLSLLLDYTTNQPRWMVRSPASAIRVWEDIIVVAGGTRVGFEAAGHLMIFPSARPLAPDNVTARFVGTGSVPFAELSWSHPAFTSLAGFIVEVGSAPGRTDFGSFGLAPTTVVQAAHPPRGTYYLRVRAVNSDGTGPPSREVRLVVP